MSFLPNQAQQVSFTITKGAPATTVAATITATVATSSFDNPPTGSVKLSAAGVSLGSVPVTGSSDPNSGLASATASISTANLPLGADSITATYSGDNNYAGSNGTGSVTITATAPASN